MWTVEKWQALGAVIESLATAAGIAVAGWWSYRLFVKRRLGYPRASLSIRFVVVTIEGARTVLRVATEIKNTGEVLLQPQWARVRVQQLHPASESVRTAMERFDSSVDDKVEAELPWTVLCAHTWDLQGKAEIEPNESETLECDFVIPAGVGRVLVYSYLSNRATKSSREIGWSASRSIRLKQPEDVKNG
jgi:hypothetical protein